VPVILKLKQMFGIAWFFIRYRDEGYHIRLRIKSQEKCIGLIIKLMKRQLMKDVRLQLVREYLADTYKPEWERYGPDVMHQVENVFGASSDLIVHYIKEAVSVNFKMPYYSVAFVSVKQMIETFIPDLTAQIIFLDQMVTSFYWEFSDDKLLKLDLNEKYRELKIELKSILSDSDYYRDLQIAEIHHTFVAQLNALVRNKALKHDQRKHQLLADLIHMHLNRLFVDDQRKQELVVYYCLWKLKLTEKALRH
jgi:thiopeptide-type bacteriocin biosynthesis protein